MELHVTEIMILVIGSLVGVIAYFAKKEVSNIGESLKTQGKNVDKINETLTQMQVDLKDKPSFEWVGDHTRARIKESGDDCRRDTREAILQHENSFDHKVRGQS